MVATADRRILTHHQEEVIDMNKAVAIPTLRPTRMLNNSNNHKAATTVHPSKAVMVEDITQDRNKAAAALAMVEPRSSN